MNELTTVDSYCQLSKTALTFKRDVTREEWQNVFDSLNHIEGCVQFWIGDCLKYREQKWGMYDDIAEETGIEKKTLQNYKSISDNVEPSRRREELTFGHHSEVAKLEPEKQKEFLDRAVNEGLSVRDLRREIVRDKVATKQPTLTNNKYRVIYADPPWEYNDKQDIPSLGGADKHYPSMSIDELCCLPIKEISENDAVLFLWTTSPLLEETFILIKEWGFEYKTSFVWDKIKHNMGHYNSVRHEFLLVCTKGSCTPDNIKLFDSVQSIEKSKNHSEKPEEFRNIIDTLYIKGKKIELFARKKVENWDAYGNEL